MFINAWRIWVDNYGRPLSCGGRARLAPTVRSCVRACAVSSHIRERSSVAPHLSSSYDSSDNGEGWNQLISRLGDPARPQKVCDLLLANNLTHTVAVVFTIRWASRHTMTQRKVRLEDATQQARQAQQAGATLIACEC